MIKAYRFKLEPNRKQKYALARTLDVCRELYNDCLYQRKLHRTNRFDQSAELTELKAAFPVYKNVYSQVLQHVVGSGNSGTPIPEILAESGDRKSTRLNSSHQI